MALARLPLAAPTPLIHKKALAGALLVPARAFASVSIGVRRPTHAVDNMSRRKRS